MPKRESVPGGTAVLPEVGAARGRGRRPSVRQGGGKSAITLRVPSLPPPQSVCHLTYLGFILAQRGGFGELLF